MALTEEQMQEAIVDRFIGYQRDPIGFFVNILGIPKAHIWDKMVAVAESVRDNRFTAVPAGHSVSKTFTAARLAVWFKTCFQPSTVITTAPSDNQVKNQLWREIHMAFAGSRVDLGGKMRVLQWDHQPAKAVLASLPPAVREDWEKNFAIGFATSPDTATEDVTRLQGFHNQHLLLILDEAGGLIPQIWRTARVSLMTDPNCRMLAIGNPTDPYSEFAQVCASGKWNVIPISVRDTPNYKQGRAVIPQVAGRLFEKDIIDEYGENSNEHKVRCLGQFPTFSEGTVWGAELARLERRGSLGDLPWVPTAPVYTVGDYGTQYTSIGFFQFIDATIRMIDYFYDDTGMGIPALCKMFDGKPYNYARSQGHWAGPDLHPQSGSNRKDWSGRTVMSDFARLGYILNACERHLFDVGVRLARDVWPLVRIDRRCMDFVEAIRRYRFKKNIKYSREGAPAYSNEVEPTPSRHPGDMFRYLSWVYRNQLVIDHVRIGYPEPAGGTPDEEQDSFSRLDYHKWRATA